MSSKMKGMPFFIFNSCLFIFFISSSCIFAWGERGHHSICEVASRLVEEKDFREFLKARAHQLGHLCNIPDIHWRSLDSAKLSVGNPTHYLNPEAIQESLEKISEDFKMIAKKLSLKSNELNEKMGSLWWRADQFYRLALKNASKAADEEKPKTREDKQDRDFPYNESIYQMLVAMGVMGHFVGDASQPYHNILDYDGWEKKRGGIHSYYETQIVDELDLDLVEKIYSKALLKKDKNSKDKSVIERMRALSVSSRNDLKKLEEIDKILKPSRTSINKYGMEFKIYAKRESPEKTAKKFEPLIVDEMARAAVLLASLWDQIYRESGRPKIKSYKSFRYPLSPPFIAPDYF